MCDWVRRRERRERVALRGEVVVGLTDVDGVSEGFKRAMMAGIGEDVTGMPVAACSRFKIRK